MARIRSIHPGIHTDEQFMAASLAARVLLPGLWIEAWDDGVIEWRPLRLKARIFPADNVNVPELLEELVGLGFLQRFSVGEREYAAIRNFRKWQNPKTPNSSNVLPSELLTYVGLGKSAPDKSGNSPNDAETTQDELGAFPRDFGNGSEKSPQKGGREEGRKEEVSLALRDDADSADYPPADTTDYNDLNKAVLGRIIVPVDQPEEEVKPAKKSDPKGTRLPEDWNPGKEGADFARSIGLDPGRTFDKFRDYWLARAGALGRKLDWPATWRNWCRKEAEDRGTLPLAPPGPSPSNPGGHATTRMTGGF